MNIASKYLILSACAIFSSCIGKNNKESIPGIYFGSATDAFVVIDINENGEAKRYNSHMGGQFEWTGKWTYLEDSIQIVYQTLNTNWENKKEINDTTMFSIDQQNGSLSFFTKLKSDTDKIKMIDSFIERTKDSVRKYDEK